MKVSRERRASVIIRELRVGPETADGWRLISLRGAEVGLLRRQLARGDYEVDCRAVAEAMLRIRLTSRTAGALGPTPSSGGDSKLCARP